MADRFHEIAPDTVEAHSITIGACACPDVHLLFLDEGGRIIARGVMTPEEFARAAASVARHVAEIRAGQGDTIGDVAGSA